MARMLTYDIGTSSFTQLRATPHCTELHGPFESVPVHYASDTAPIAAL